MSLFNFFRTGLSPCGQIVQKYDRDRYLCALFTDKNRREALFAIYAFYQEISKIRHKVSDPILSQIRFQWWRESIDKIPEGRIERHEIVIGLDVAIRDYKLPRTLFFELIDICESDLASLKFTGTADLIDFCLKTDGKLCDIGLEILNATNVETYRAGRNISVAWGLIKCLRNLIFFGYQKANVIPKEIAEKHEVIESKVLDYESHDGLRAAVKELCLLAKQNLNSARKLTHVEYKIASPILLQGCIIEVYLKELENAGWNIFDQSLKNLQSLQVWRLLLASMRRKF